MMSRYALMLAVLLLIPGMSYAQSRVIGENVTYGYAQVLRASPVYQQFRVRVPEQRCARPVFRQESDAAIRIEGARSSESKRGDRAGRGDGGGRSATGPGCRTIEVMREERRLIGYDVEYQYQGLKYMSRLDRDPGNRLRIRVSIIPDDLVSRSR